jgi:hypothetical protein
MLTLASKTSKIWLDQREQYRLKRLTGQSVNTFSDGKALQNFKADHLSEFPGDSPEEQLMKHLIRATLSEPEERTQKP